MATQKNVAMCSSTIRANDFGLVPEVSRNTSSRTSTGVTRVMTRWNARGTREKAMMNVTRYSASGMIHSKGSEAMSVETKVVTESIRLDGTNASPSQRRRIAQPGGVS